MVLVFQKVSKENEINILEVYKHIVLLSSTHRTPRLKNECGYGGL